MAESHHGYDLEGLAALVAADPGSPEFPALAEAARRCGEPERARQIAAEGLEAAPARLAGRVALGLALLDLGRAEEASAELATILDAVVEPHRIEEAILEAEPVASDPLVGTAGRADVLLDDEIDEAFAAAEPRMDEMISPNTMAERVLFDHAPVDAGACADLGAPPADGDEEAAAAGVGASSPLFRTATMADLLDRQGDAAGAEAIRRALSGVDDVGDVADFVERAEDAVAGSRTRTLSTLEQWLENIQRGMA